LPAQLTRFVGRRHERAQAIESLAATRLLVLTGPGGTGKTRLALEVAAASATSFPDGASWVDLAPVGDSGQVPDALANVLDVRPLPGRTQTQAAVMKLGDSRSLVVLDNCEHVTEGAADLCEALLRGCPGVVVLATSRTPLRVPGESDWPVPPMSLPSTDTPDEIERTDAGALFVDRATRAQPRFALGDGNAAAVAHICREVDGLPLAIELASARVRMMSPAQVADGLRNRFKLLTGGPRGVLPRHQTLRASVDWSHDLLSADERLLFRRLAVFTGGWSLDAVEAVCAGGALTSDTILDVLTSLIDSSLVVADQPNGEVRYRLLETVRAYSLELLAASDEAAALRDRHLDYFLALAEQAAEELQTPRLPRWIEALEPESANLDAAVAHAAELGAAEGLRLGVALAPWWRVRGRYEVGVRGITAVLEAAEPTPSPLRARALWNCGFLARLAGDRERAGHWSLQARDTAEAVGDAWTLSMSLQTLAALQMFRDPVASRPALVRARELCRQHGDPWPRMAVDVTLARSYVMTGDFEDAERALSEADALIREVGPEAACQIGATLSYCAWARGDLDQALAHATQAASVADGLGDALVRSLADVVAAWVELARGRAGDALGRMNATESQLIARGAVIGMAGVRIEAARALAALGRPGEARDLLEVVVSGETDGGWHHARALLALSDALLAVGDLDGARSRATEALELSDRVGLRWQAAAARESLAVVRVAAGDWTDAEALVHDALARFVDLGVPVPVPQLFDTLAQIACGLESHVESARLMGAADRARADLGTVRSPPQAADLAGVEQTLREQLGSDGFDAAYMEGRAVAADQAVAWARRSRGARKRPSAGWESLTPTERQIVELVVEGLTNPQIAARMFIARGTAKVHLEHIYDKLDVHTRSELAVLAARRALEPS
jgi:predicted ATPase/DNA-binding CsgD family transcriptional regulator